MFDEKIKIRVSKFLRQTLELDAMIFNYIKPDGDANINGYLNKLIPNLLQLKKNDELKLCVLPKTDLALKTKRLQTQKTLSTN